MKLIRFFLLITILPVLLSARPVDRSDRKEMLKEVSKIEDLFNRFYAPKEFKEAHEGYKIETLFKDLRKTLKQKKNLNVAEYQQELQKTLGTLGDYHVGINFFRTARSSLPFDVMHSEGRYFVIGVDEDVETAVFEIGDELLAFNGVPIHEEVLRLHYETQNRAPTLTDISVAAMRLSFRYGGSGITPPKGTAKILFKKKNGGETLHHTFDWNYREEQVPALLAPKEKKVPEMKACGNDLFILAEKKLSQRVFRPKECSIQPVHNSPYCPAFTFEHEGLVYGYIKIACYDDIFEMDFETFQETIDYLQKHTDALVIDQLGNPGGGVYYLYAIASMLSDTPLVVPKHRVTLSYDEASYFIDLREFINSSLASEDELDSLSPYFFEGYPVTQETVSGFLSYIDFYLQELEEGKKISSPCAFLGIDAIKPHNTTRYTKPIVMLVDELCFSGGDFMPAILQDNGRATIMGRKTAGAGGVVAEASFLSAFGVAGIRMTTSIAERADGSKIESLGVEPDIYSPITPYDIETDFEGFTDSVIKVLKGKVEEQKNL